MKYVDADKLIVEIDRLLAKAKNDEEKAFVKKDAAGHLTAVTKTAVCAKIKKLISTLQQEQLEVDLDFQVFAKEMDAVFNLPKEVTENTEENPLNWEYAIACHFYKLGLNARK